ncbi:MAG: YfiR family protein [Planctomycetota bacterium]|nr:MAG: YfiR family protein [Planctomycetota bacterium]
MDALSGRTRACRRLVLVLLPALLLAPVTPGPLAAGAHAPDEVRAAMVYRLLHFVTWPEGRLGDAIEVCLDSSVAHPSPYLRLDARRVAGRVVHARGCEGDACRPCNVRLTERPVPDAPAGQLVVALREVPQAMLSLIETGGRIELRGNPSAWRRAGLSISARLMRVMRLDGGGRP